MKKLVNKLNTYFLYTIIFIALCILVFLKFIITGRSFVSIISPFTDYSPMLYTALVILRIFCIGITFIIYCNYHKKGKFGTLLGSLIYTFSGYILYASLSHPVYATAAAILPLMFLGVDRIFKNNKFILFMIVSAILVALGGYFLYVISILTLIYAITKYFNEFKNKNIKTFCLKFGEMLLAYILGILVATFALFHTINIFANLKLNVDFGFTYYDFNYILRSGFMSFRSAYWSKAYIVPLVITMLPVAALNFKKNKENRTLLINLFVLSILFVIPFFGYIMNGFTFEPNKWAFAFSFVLSYLVTTNIRYDLVYSPREFKFIKKCLLLYLVVWFIFRSHIGNVSILNFLFAFIYLIILLARSLDYSKIKKEQQFEYSKDLKSEKSAIIREKVKLVLIFAVILNIFFFSWNLYSNLKYSTEFVTFKEYKELISKTSIPENKNFKNVNFEFQGKKIKKILKDNTITIAKKRKSFNLSFDESKLGNCELYLVISNLKYTKNGQYSITVKYNETKQKKTIRDVVVTPDYIKTDDIIFDLGDYSSQNNIIKLTFSTNGVYSFDNINLISVDK